MPNGTLAQRTLALEAANRVRQVRAEVRAEVKSLPRNEGCALVADVIEKPPREFRSMPVGLLMLWPRQMHSRTVLGMLSAARVREGRALRELSPRQCAVLAEGLRSIEPSKARVDR